MATDYSDILKTSWDDVQPPSLLPTGSWSCKVRAMKLAPPKDPTHKAQVLVMVEPIEPMEDVSSDALQEMGEDWQKQIENIAMRFWFETAADKAKVKNFLIALGVDLTGLDFEGSFKAAKDATFVGYVTTDSYTDKLGNPQVKNVVASFTKAA